MIVLLLLLLPVLLLLLQLLSPLLLGWRCFLRPHNVRNCANMPQNGVPKLTTMPNFLSEAAQTMIHNNAQECPKINWKFTKVFRKWWNTSFPQLWKTSKHISPDVKITAHDSSQFCATTPRNVQIVFSLILEHVHKYPNVWNNNP